MTESFSGMHNIKSSHAALLLRALSLHSQIQTDLAKYVSKPADEFIVRRGKWKLVSEPPAPDKE